MVIAVSGGIGVGKTVVSRVVACMGYPVYDTDSRAKKIMDNSPVMKTELARAFGEDIVTDGVINRARLGEIVFNDAKKLAILNVLVHGAVIEDFRVWASLQKRNIVFVETALLYQSGLDRYVDMVWEVMAPLEVRVDRVIRRNNTTRHEVLSRIDSQKFSSRRSHPHVRFIDNDGQTPILPQVLGLLGRL